MEKKSNSNEVKKQDIFDKIMHMGFLKVFEPFYKENKEVLMYLFFGVLTTAVSFITAGLSKCFLEKILSCTKDTVSYVSTVFSWICSVTFAYITNRIWVFKSEKSQKKALISELASFYGGRIFTLLLELFIMWLGYSILEINYWATKIFANILVLILNYIISKLFVFRKC